MAKSADAFRTISEVAEWLETPAHVLRFWESKFSQVKPVKRAGGRRYYRPSDMQLLGGIKKLLHEDGLTIKGVQKILREQGVKHVAALSQPLDEVTEAEASEMAQDVPLLEDDPATGTVLNFKRGSKSEKASKSAGSDTPSADEAEPVTEAEVEPEATLDNADSATAPEEEEHVETATEAEVEVEVEAEPAAADEPEAVSETAPDLPSFMHLRPDPETAPEVAETDSQDAPAPTKIDVPDDPDDNITAETGVLSALAACKTPIDTNLADRLRSISEQVGALGQDRGA